MKKKEVMYLLISTVLLVFAWIGFSVYHNYTASTIKPAVGFQIAPIDPSFDIKTIESIKQRIQVDPLFEIQVSTPSATPSPTSIPTPTPSIKPSITISPTTTPTATNSASNVTGGSNSQ